MAQSHLRFYKLIAIAVSASNFLPCLSLTIWAAFGLGLPLAKRLVEEGHQVSGSTTRLERISELEAAGVHAFQLKAENGKWQGRTNRIFSV